MTTVATPTVIKSLALIGASAPVVWLLVGVFGWWGQSLGPNPVREMLHFTGKTSLNLLMLTLMASPLRTITGQMIWQRPRRLLGVAAFCYALLHFLIYAVLELDLDFSDLARELTRRPYIIIGTLALLGLIPLAATSTDRMMRKLGRRWQTLHRLVYPIAILAIWHYYWQVKADIREPLWYAAVLGVLLGWRVWSRAQRNTQRGTRRQPSESSRSSSR